MKKYLLIPFLACIYITMYASTNDFQLSKLQQNRLNLIIKQLKLPFGEYKLSVQFSWATIENFTLPTPEIQVVEKEKLVTETKTIEVPKEVIVEKILLDPRVKPGSVIFNKEDIQRIRSCGANYPRETADYKAQKGTCIVEYLLSRGDIYNSEP